MHRHGASIDTQLLTRNFFGANAMPSLILPDTGGVLRTFTLSEPKGFPRKVQGAFNRVAYSAAHVVADPLSSADPWISAAVDWEATIAHGLHHDRVVGWLRADSDRARFYAGISEKTRLWSIDRRGDYWYAADALAMAFALAPEGTLERAERPLAIELQGTHSRGASVVDWRREGGKPDKADILLKYDQERFEALIQAALAAR
jgi:purine nucleosidase